MPIEVTCKTCSKQYRLKDELRGKRFPCKQCGGVVKIRGGAATKPPRLPVFDHDRVRIRSRSGGTKLEILDGDGNLLLNVFRTSDADDSKIYQLDFQRPDRDQPSLTIAKTKATSLDREFTVRRGRKKIGRLTMSRSFPLQAWRTYLVIYGRHFALFEGGRRFTGVRVSGDVTETSEPQPSSAMMRLSEIAANLIVFLLLGPIIAAIAFVLFYVMKSAALAAILITLIVTPFLVMLWLLGMLIGVLPDPRHMSIGFFRGPVPVAKLWFFGRNLTARLTRKDAAVDLTVCVLLSVFRVIGEARTVNYFQLEDQSMQPQVAWKRT